MTTGALPAEDGALLTALNGIPKVDFPGNLQAAIAAGRRMSSILGEVIALRRGPGKLTPNEYFYYRLWEPRLSPAAKRRFVGKQAQQPMHIACNNTGWYATAADKLLFHTLMTGAALPRPELLAITHPKRRVAGAQTVASADAITAFLRDPSNYPLFGKPIDGKYSLSVISADGYDPAADQVILYGAEPAAPAALARALAGREAGYVLQRRLPAHRCLARLFGPRLWSARVIVLMMPSGPVIHRAVAKIATGQNPADNFWRRGNMVGAIDLGTGQVARVIAGTGAEMAINGAHPDTGRPIVGTPIPDWGSLTALGRVDKAYPLFDCGQLGKAEKAAGGMIVSRGDAPAVLEAVEEALDPVAGGVERPIDRVLDGPVLLGRNLRPAAAGADLVANGVAVITLVGQHHLGIGIVFGHQIAEGGAVVSFARRQQQRDRKTLSVGPSVDFGRKPAARTAKSLVLNPPLAPAAQWCARMTVLSTICTAWLPPPSADASSIRSHSPLAVQRRNCRCTEFQLPSSSGRSRQGAPVRAIQNTASSVRRWSRGGRPRNPPVAITKGLKNAHSLSVRRPRTTADLPHEDQLRIMPRRVVGIPQSRFVHAT